MALSLATTALLAPIEKAVNSLLAQDPHAMNSLAQFRSKLIEVQTPHAGCSMRFVESGIRLGALHEGAVPEAADAIITGPAPALLKLLKDGERPLADSDIRIEGDAEFLLDLQQTLAGLDIRWEDLLQPVLGDVLTGSIGDAVAGARNWSRKAGVNIRRNLANYLQYEAGVMPTPEELEAFADRVDELRLRLDRLEARLERLGRKQ